MNYYKNQIIVNGRVYILYGREGNICIWKDLGRTQARMRDFYANPGQPMHDHSVRSLRSRIREYLEANE